MNNVQRFREVLNLLDNGSIISFPSTNDNLRYGMDESGAIGCCIYDKDKGWTDELLMTDFTYSSWLETVTRSYKELYDNMFDIDFFSFKNTPAICITTNGETDKYGKAVMGKGNALQFKKLFPGIEIKLGKYLKQYGNRAFYLGTYQIKDSNSDIYLEVKIISFPTKHKWKDNSDITLINKSCEQIIEICNKFNIETCFIPVPGCGNGGLNYSVTVKPVLELMLDDRFYICFNQ